MTQIIMIAGIFAIMYFMVIRPQKKRQQELALMRDNLAVGDKVVTIGAIVGEVTALDDSEFTLLTAGSTALVFKRTAIAVVEPKQAPEAAFEAPPSADEPIVTVAEDDGIREQETEIKE